MQHTVDGEQLELLVHGVPRLRFLALPGGDLGAEHDVAEQPLRGSSASFDGGRSSSIGNDMTSVGPGRSIHWMCSCSMASASTTITESSESGWIRIRASA
ncbi:hypothetical protein SHKM778_77420 [Streptomyces sp. KM77-8]|uniref:Uncharacterized protein n=1 Tax=Streptomyces haneummycinicus TaxID=3074435 RepID=A0AAT9HV03_9ACTN